MNFCRQIIFVSIFVFIRQNKYGYEYGGIQSAFDPISTLIKSMPEMQEARGEGLRDFYPLRRGEVAEAPPRHLRSTLDIISKGGVLQPL